MKRANNLYKDIYNIDNIRKVYNEVKKGCNNIKGLYLYECAESANLYRIAEKLYRKEYTFSQYHVFLIREPKYRLIMSENIPDKIVNHLISRYLLLPALDHKLIDTNVATRICKGSGYAFDMLTRYLRKLILEQKKIYILKIDIKKYFYNIDHNILRKKLVNEIKDKEALELIFASLDTTNESYVNEIITRVKHNEIKKIKSLKINEKEKRRKISEIEKIPLYDKNKGLGIGNMTSQILAVYYLNDVDHFIKEKLKCKYYIRYMDDLIILDNDYDKLKRILPIIEKEINKLNLEINDKSRIIDMKRGLSFLGYTYSIRNKFIIKVNNQTLRRIKKHLKVIKKNSDDKYKLSIASYKGFFEKSDYFNKEFLS